MSTEITQGINYQKAAKFIFQNAKSEVTALSVQKLLYFAHGLMLAKYDRPLVSVDFQAWKYGPVIEPLYFDLKIFGPIPIKATSLSVKDWSEIDCINEAEEQKCLLSVLEQFGDYSASQLVNLSHLKNGPWDVVFNSKNSKNLVIENDSIKNYFKTKIK